MAKLKLIESFMTVLQSAGVFAVSDVNNCFIFTKTQTFATKKEQRER